MPPARIVGERAQPERPGSEASVHLSLLRSRRRRVLRPTPEMIESRVLLSGYSPTDVEQYYLELLDDARFNPAAYGQSLGLNLSNVAPAQPLAMNEELVES